MQTKSKFSIIINNIYSKRKEKRKERRAVGSCDARGKKIEQLNKEKDFYFLIKFVIPRLMSNPDWLF